MKKRNMLPAVGAMLTLASATQAVVVNINLSGTYDTNGDSVFGLTGSAVPFSYDMVYDTDLDDNSFFFASGSNIGPFEAIHDWYGYSDSGIVSSNFTFGTHTFPMSAISPRTITSGVSAHFWTDADIATSTPNHFWMSIYDGSDELVFDGAAADETYLWMYQGLSDIIDDDEGSDGNSENMTITVTPVPEPTTLAVFGLGALWFARNRTRKAL